MRDIAVLVQCICNKNKLPPSSSSIAPPPHDRVCVHSCAFGAYSQVLESKENHKMSFYRRGSGMLIEAEQGELKDNLLLLRVVHLLWRSLRTEPY